MEKLSELSKASAKQVLIVSLFLALLTPLLLTSRDGVVLASPETFGYEIAGSTLVGVDANSIYGSVFTILEAGTADSITWYGRGSSLGTGYVKCAIYKHSDLSLVGETERTKPSSTVTWYTNNFSDPKPSLEADTAYILVAWFQHSSGRFYYNAGDADQGHHQVGVGVPNGFPNPLVPTHSNKKCSIYCTYTPLAAEPGEPVLVSPENNYSTSDNTPTFVWENGSNATSHRLVIDNSQNFDDGENICDNTSAWDNSGTAIENELPVDNYWWKVCASNAQGDNWSENTWTFEVTPPPVWQLIEEWVGDVEAPVKWELVESWDGNILAYAEWQQIESWGGTVEAFSEWVLIEGWSGIVLAYAEWVLVETWTGTIMAPEVGAWGLIEEWSATVEAYATWQAVESWVGVIAASADWLSIEIWDGTIGVSAPVFWSLIETWQGTVESFVEWYLMETWVGTIISPVEWEGIETWIGVISTLSIPTPPYEPPGGPRLIVTIRIIALDAPTGIGLSGVRIEAIQLLGGAVAKTRTDEYGVAILFLNIGTYDVSLTKEGYDDILMEEIEFVKSEEMEMMLVRVEEEEEEVLPLGWGDMLALLIAFWALVLSLGIYNKVRKKKKVIVVSEVE